MTLMIIIMFYCGHQSILAEYNSLSLGIFPLLVALELTFMDVHTVKVCSLLVNRVDNYRSCIISD